MKPFRQFSLNIRGRLVEYDRPVVMGILNATDDSFYDRSRLASTAAVVERASQMVSEGADILDLGACSTRPGAESVSANIEWERVQPAIEAVKAFLPHVPLSIDTFRSSVASKAVEHGADIINDISGGTADPDMVDTVASLRVPYILMHMRGTPADMQSRCDYSTDPVADVLSELSERLRALNLKGVCDVIIDPGFGFSKNLEQNYRLLDGLEWFETLGCPLLVGVSRKSMVYKACDCTPNEALPGTIAVQTLALERGASILRVHDVAATRQSVDIVTALRVAAPSYSTTIRHLVNPQNIHK